MIKKKLTTVKSLNCPSWLAVGGKCNSYEWKTSAWSDNVREVWCQRSDGVNVTGNAMARTSAMTSSHYSCTSQYNVVNKRKNLFLYF